ncbi:MAG: nicotinamide-nucleotide adenylyltransferase [Candidatus Altiarchaeota archaeon]
MKALVVGRFQPLHKGHVSLIEYAAAHSGELLIGVGSSNKSGVKDNPFSFEEREDMIVNSLVLDVGFEVVGIPDFGDDGKWMEWISENLDFDAYYGNTERETNLFRQAGFSVVEVPFFNRVLYSATEVRRRIVEDGDWRSLVPDAVAKVIEESGGVDKVRKLDEP